VANARVHGTTREVPRERFARDERAVLQPLASRAYRSLVLTPPAQHLQHIPTQVSGALVARPVVASLPTPAVLVERRGLAAYAQLAEAYADTCAEEVA
jgi:hypothetical protein